VPGLRQVEVGSLEEVIGKMQADASGEWASVMFIPAGARTPWAGPPLFDSFSIVLDTMCGSACHRRRMQAAPGCGACHSH